MIESAGGRKATWEQAVMWLRVQHDLREEVLNCYYDDPLLAAAERYWQSTEWGAIRGFLPQRGRSALDVGAGRGIASYALAREGFQVTALEPDTSPTVGAEAIRSLARDSALPIQVVEEFSESLPFDDASFDLVFARAVLHHANNLESACREFFRVLRPGGVLLAVREHVLSRQDDLAHFLEHHLLHRRYGGENAFLLHHYTNSIAQAGFGQIRVISPWRSVINYFPHTLSSLKNKICSQVGKRYCFLGQMSKAILDVPGMWPLASFFLEKFDHRPGRLYSFVARKT